MVKTHKDSRFALLTLADIRDSKDVILQVEDTKTNFDNGHKCYLCEVVNSFMYHRNKNEEDLILEICELNKDKRKLEKKMRRLEKQIEKLKDGAE